MGPRTTRGEAGRSAAGFTLVEILVVVVILGILVALAQPRIQSAVVAAREATLRQNLLVLRDVLDRYYADHDAYPASLDLLVERRYLRVVPRDPVTGRADTWVLVPYTDDRGLEEGIYDVRSGSEEVAIDGTSYRDW